jgi:hypothetical protein
VSKPAVFLVEPWTIQSVQTHRQHLLSILPTLLISPALPIPTLPAVPEPVLFHQRVASMNFPAWSGQSSVQPMFVEKSALSIFPDEPAAAQICGADFSPYWHGCRCPLVWTNSPFRQALDHKSSRLIVSTCCRLCRFRWLCRFQANAAEADTAAESADTVPRAATAPVSKPAVFLVEPWTVQPVQTHRQHLVPILPTLPIPTLPPVP